ncbi:MAG: hypothetical protein PHP53_02785 [Prolixibacteraceae bacterium]|nr:hypothetical protein [Prolixibacteraceae bacterium]
MPEEKDIFYKNLCFKISSKFDYLEVLIDDINFSDQKTYIASVSVLLEYALAIYPRYVIINKLNSKFRIVPELYSFTQKNIIAPLKSNGVRKIIVLTDEGGQRYKDIEKEEPFIKAFASKAEVIKWISENP